MFMLVFATIIPIYINILLGFWAGRRLQVDTQSIASLLFYMISPVVMFSGPARLEWRIELITLPVVTGILGAVLAFISFLLSRRWWHDHAPFMLGMSAGTANVGYLGLPLAMVLLEPEVVNIYIVAILGVSLFENSVGYLMLSHAEGGGWRSWFRIFRIPTLYAYALGCLCSYLSLTLPDAMQAYIHNVRGCYAVLGILQIGLGLSRLQEFRMDWRFTGFALMSRFVLAPLVSGLLVLADYFLFRMFDRQVYAVLMLQSIMPLASNTIGLSILFRIHPEKMASATTFSMVCASVYVPSMLWLGRVVAGWLGWIF